MSTVEWTSDGITLPQKVEEALKSDSLVFFCGAGVSSAKPSELPGFRGLAVDLSRTLGHPELVPADLSVPVQFDVVMGKLDEISGDVHRRVSTRLQAAVTPNAYHIGIWKIAGSNGRTARIVTTNFDLLFEAAARENGVDPSVHIAPTLPLGDDFSGLVHLHGVQNPPSSTRMVLTDQDFGRAYITEGWATQFLTRLFAKFTVVLIGYSAEDTILQYLNRALPNNGERFAFTQSAGSYELWHRLGITPVPFPSTTEDPYGALESFVMNWSARLTSSSSQRFDQVARFIEDGPETAALSPDKTAWTLKDPELARHFRLGARSSEWLGMLDRAGVLEALFDAEGDCGPEAEEWSQWICSSIDDDEGAPLLAVLARHEGRMHPQLWFHVWHKMYQEFNGSISHRQLIFVLTVSQRLREPDRISLLLSKTVEIDPEVSELLLLHLLTPQLQLKVRSGWSFRDDSLEPRYRLTWRTSLVRDVWPKLMPRLLDRAHLLSVVLDLIRVAERTDSFFMGRDRQDAISLRREQVEHAEIYPRDDPYILVVDMARDLLREHVRDHGTREALRCLDDRSEMIRRIGIDALAEARSTESDSLLEVLIQQGLLLEYRGRPEVFKLMAATYKNASDSMKQSFLEYLQAAYLGSSGVGVSEYEMFNILAWISHTVGPDDPVCVLRDALANEHGYEPEEFPNLSFIARSVAIPDAPTEIEGRFRGLGVRQVVLQLIEDHGHLDEYLVRPTVRELLDYLKNTPSAQFPLLDEMVAQELWTTSIWSAVLQDIVRGPNWNASDLVARLKANSDNSALMAARLAFPTAYPELDPNRHLNNGVERYRLLLSLWQLAAREEGVEGPTNSSEARATSRGSLAHYYVETLLRSAQQEGEAFQISSEGTHGLQQLLDAQVGNPADPSPMMVTEFASNLQFRAPEWFQAKLLPRLTALDGSPHAATVWAGLLARRFPAPNLREVLKEQLRTGWSHVASNLPASIEAFIQLHSICYVYDFGKTDLEWADAFLTHAPVAARERWIRSVAHFADQDGDASKYQELIFKHWSHRLDGQPPISGTEERAFLRWLTLPGMDVPRATELFIRGPAVAIREEDRYDYYDLKGFPKDEFPKQFLMVSNHLMQGNVYSPPFVAELLAAANQIAATDASLARRTLNRLLSLGYSPARILLREIP
jgi:hypothetical protein